MNEHSRSVVLSATTANKEPDLFPQENTDQWATPWPLFKSLDAEFGFTLDVCALPHSAKCANYYTPEDDGLKQVWSGVCWCNPPYGRAISRWIEKASYSAMRGDADVVMLIPVRSDTTWWHDHIWNEKANEPMPFVEVRFIRGRVKFGGAKSGAPFPSVIVVFKRWPK